jgi:hypothetical protein
VVVVLGHVRRQVRNAADYVLESFGKRFARFGKGLNAHLGALGQDDRFVA